MSALCAPIRYIETDSTKAASNHWTLRLVAEQSKITFFDTTIRLSAKTPCGGIGGGIL